MSEKQIAKIYYDVQVLLTTNGELYGYVFQSNGKPRCRKLTAKQKIDFWEKRQTGIRDKGVQWHPVARGGLQNDLKFIKGQGRDI